MTKKKSDNAIESVAVKLKKSVPLEDFADEIAALTPVQLERVWRVAARHEIAAKEKFAEADEQAATLAAAKLVVAVAVLLLGDVEGKRVAKVLASGTHPVPLPAESAALSEALKKFLQPFLKARVDRTST